MERLMEIIEDELNKVADKGLSASNIDTAYKLVDMWKDIKQCEEGGYSQRYDHDNSYGRYSNTRSRGYSRNGYSMKARDLEDYLSDYTGQLESMLREANPDEKDIIKKYITRLKAMQNNVYTMLHKEAVFYGLFFVPNVYTTLIICNVTIKKVRADSP